MARNAVSAFSLLLAFAPAACGGSSSSGGADGSTRACTPGQSIACVGVGGCSGGQVCGSDGSSYGECQCGPASSGGSDAGGSDGGVDTGADALADALTVADAAGDAPAVFDAGPLVCGNAPCSGNTECCAVQTDAGGVAFQCLASCPGGGGSVQCTSSQQCPQSTSACCGTLQLDGTGTNCTFGAESSACAASCTSSVWESCPATQVVQFCGQKADCTDPDNANCCTIIVRGSLVAICLADDVAVNVPYAGGSCLQ